MSNSSTKATITAALEPFANVIDAAREKVQDWMTAPNFTIGACRRAREALALLSSSPDDGEDWRTVASELREGQECAEQAREAWDNGTWDREYVKGAFDAIDDALAIAEKHATQPDATPAGSRGGSSVSGVTAGETAPAPDALGERARAIVASWLQDCPLVGVRFEERERLQWLIAEALVASESIAPSPEPAEFWMPLPPREDASASPFDLVAHLVHQREWSEKTFGPGRRTQSIIDHIHKELAEIEADSLDLEEWVDVIILAFDGAWRAGWEPSAIIEAIAAKQAKNEARKWPDWRTMSADQAIEHDRSADISSGLSAPLDPATMDAAQAAVDRMDARKDENVEEWARKLGADLAAAGEQEYGLSAPLAGLETTAEERERWMDEPEYSLRETQVNRLLRDIDRLTAALAEAKAEIARRDDLAEAHRAAIAEAKAETARARETELADIASCIRSTAWGGSEEIIAMLRRRIENYRRAHIEKGQP